MGALLVSFLGCCAHSRNDIKPAGNSNYECVTKAWCDTLSKSKLIHISQNYNLDGEVISLPDGVEIKIDAGSFLNGTIKGNIKNEYLRPEWFGAIGDNNCDDTNALYNCLLSSIYTRTPVLLKGQYKITKPLTFYIHHYDADSERLPLSINIYGTSNSQITSDYRNKLENIPDAAIIAYNLKDGEAALNFLGNSVVACQSNTLKNFSIFCDRTTCSELSFCLRIGNSDNFLAEKMDFQGFNNVIIRSGEVDNDDDVGFIFARGLFQNCRFTTWPYLNNDGSKKRDSSVLFGGKTRFGFCVINERFLNYTKIGKSSPFDSIKFLCCNFVGSSYLCGNVSFDMCMWQIPGCYKPKIEKITDNRFRGLPFIDTSIAVFHTIGNVVYDNCHFEDCLKCIYVYSNATEDYQRLLLNIRDCTFVPWLNFSYYISKHKVVPEYLININKSPKASSKFKVEINGGQMLSAPDRSTYKKAIINNGSDWVFINYVVGIHSNHILNNSGKISFLELY